MDEFLDEYPHDEYPLDEDGSEEGHVVDDDARQDGGNSLPFDERPEQELEDLNKQQAQGRARCGYHCWARLVHVLWDTREALSTISSGKTRQQLCAGDNPYEKLAALFNDTTYMPQPHPFMNEVEWVGCYGVKPAQVKKKITGAEFKKKMVDLKGVVTKWDANYKK